MGPWTGCPSSIELERAFFSEDADVGRHASGCPTCGPQWVEMTALVQAGTSLEAPASPPHRREELRAAILGQSATSVASKGWVPPARRRWSWPVIGLGAATAACALVLALVWSGGRGSIEVPAPVLVGHRGHVLDHGAATWQHSVTAADEVVRLVTGTLTVNVDPLRPGERFRVITGDSEVEVHGTAFDVTAASDRLVAVRVLHGVVEVRPAVGPALFLRTGADWKAPPTVAVAAIVESAAVVERAANPGPAPPGPPNLAVARAVRPRLQSEPRARSAGSAAPVGAPGTTIDSPPDDAPVVNLPRRERAFEAGWRALRDGRFSAASDAFEEAAATAKDPGEVEDARYWRGVSLARAGSEGAAADAFAGYLLDYPASVRAGEVSVILGWILFERGEYDGAQRRFASANSDASPRVRASALAGLSSVERAQGAAPAR